MSKVICICGKIASGKSWYAKKISVVENAVILSTDEVTYDLINNEQGEFYNIFSKRVNKYLRKKAVEIVKVGANVVLDWGFWTKEDRKDISIYFEKHNIKYEWHYIDINDDDWYININKRNKSIKEGNNKADFYVDEGLLNKLLDRFEKPEQDEIDIWYHFKRK